MPCKTEEVKEGREGGGGSAAFQREMGKEIVRISLLRLPAHLVSHVVCVLLNPV